MKKNTKKIWKGNFYLRGGLTKDKWGNITKKPISYKQVGSGYVVDNRGTWLGKETVHKNNYGSDYVKIKKPKGWKGDSIRHHLAAKGIRTGRK